VYSFPFTYKLQRNTFLGVQFIWNIEDSARLLCRPPLDARPVEPVVAAPKGLLFLLQVERNVPVNPAQGVASDEALPVGAAHESRRRFRVYSRSSRGSDVTGNLKNKPLINPGTE